jgi:hypothetical protein
MLASYLNRKGTALGDTLEQLVMFPAGVVTAFPWLVALLIAVGLAAKVLIWNPPFQLTMRRFSSIIALGYDGTAVPRGS